MVKVRVKGQATGTQRTASQSQPRTLPRQNIIIRCVHVIIDDIRWKLLRTRTPDRAKWEEYERFCRMAREGSVRKGP
jgi:hypothetical protein